MGLFEERLRRVVRTKLGTKVIPGRRSPKLNVAISMTKRLAAEHAADRAAVHEILAAREHANPSID